MSSESDESHRRHQRMWSNLAYHIGQIGYGDGDEFTLEELGERLAQAPERPGRYRRASIERYLHQYFDRHLESPLLKAERDGCWRINPILYRARPPPAELRIGGPVKYKLDLTDAAIESRRSRRACYERNYRRLTRHPELYLSRVFKARQQADLRLIAANIRKMAEGVQFEPTTIERILHEYESGQRQGRIRGPPYLEEVSLGTWRYSDEPAAGSSDFAGVLAESRGSHLTRYNRNYRRLTRHPERYLSHVFGSEAGADLATVTAGIRDLAEGVQFEPTTIERILHEYESGQRQGRIRGPPYLEEVSHGRWRYSSEPPTGQ